MFKSIETLIHLVLLNKLIKLINILKKTVLHNEGDQFSDLFVLIPKYTWSLKNSVYTINPTVCSHQFIVLLTDNKAQCLN